MEQKEQDKLLKDYSDGVLASQKELRIAVRHMQGIVSQEVADVYIKTFVKRLKYFLQATNTLTGAQVKLVLHAIELLQEADND